MPAHGRGVFITGCLLVRPLKAGPLLQLVLLLTLDPDTHHMCRWTRARARRILEKRLTR